MNIIVNGKRKEISSSLDLKSAVALFCGNKSPVVAELNGNIIRPPQWEETSLQEGDVVELVSFVGGG